MLRKQQLTLLVCATTVILLLSTLGASSVQACTFNDRNYLPSQLSSSQIVAAAHWNITERGIQGGWIFAILGRDPGLCNKAWIYVSGFHPSGVMGPSNITFSGTNSSVDLNYYDNLVSVTAIINFTAVTTTPTGTTTAAFDIHTVNINWTLPQTAKNHFNCFDRNFVSDKDTWSDTTAFVSIDIFGSVNHATFPTSDWATIGILNPQNTLAVAHWIIEDPKAGGWVFAATGQSTLCRDAWLYVAGYHPAGAAGPTATIFESLNTTGVNLYATRNTIKIPTLTMNFTEFLFSTAVPTVSYAAHDVSINWMLQPQLRTICSQWLPASADAAINIHGSTEHAIITTSSFAMAKTNPLSCWR